MANVILLWSDSLLRIKLSNGLKLFKKLPQRILGHFFMIMIIYFHNNNDYYYYINYY